MAAERKLNEKIRNKNEVQEGNGLLMSVLYWGVRTWLFFGGVKIKTVNKVGEPKQPSIVLCNHGSFGHF